MAKKKNNNALIIAVVCLVLGVVSAAMMFLPAVVIAEDWSYTGFQIAFGHSTGNIVSIKVLEANVLAIFAIVLPVLAGLVACLLSKQKGLLMAIIPAVLFAAGAALMFLMPSYLDNGAVWKDLLAALETSSAGGLGVGAIIGGVCSSLGALICVAKPFI